MTFNCLYLLDHEDVYSRDCVDAARSSHGRRATTVQLRSNDPNNRARAHIMLRGSPCAGATCSYRSKSWRRSTSSTAGNVRRLSPRECAAHTCPAVPGNAAARCGRRVRQIYNALPWTKGLALEHFQVTRFLAVVHELQGNELAAFGFFKKDGKCAARALERPVLFGSSAARAEYRRSGLFGRTAAGGKRHRATRLVE